MASAWSDGAAKGVLRDWVNCSIQHRHDSEGRVADDTLAGWRRGCSVWRRIRAPSLDRLVGCVS